MITPSTDGAVSHGRLYWVDALRGVAALAVMFSHYVWTPLGQQQGIFHYLISPGEFGVATFFCVSGFIIPFSVKNVTGTGVVGFAVNRMFRLYPLYWLSLALTVLMFPVGMSQLLVNLTMAQRFLGTPDLNGVFWTLQVELVFYAVVAMIIVSSLHNRCAAFLVSGFGALGLTVACAVARHFLDLKAPIALFTGLSLMFFVAAYFENLRTPRFTPQTLTRSGAVAAIVLTISWFVAYDRNWGAGEVPILSAITMVVSYGLAVATFFLAARFPRRFPRGLLYIGAISYPLYLFHEAVHVLLGRVVGTSLGFWATSVMAAVLTVVLAAALHHWVELPMVALGKVASRRWRPSPRLPVHAAPKAQATQTVG